MNKLVFIKGSGLVLNDVAIPGTDNANWEALVLRIGQKPVSIVVTTEVPLNGSMANCGPEFAAFNAAYAIGSAFLQAAELRTRVYSWRMLGPLSRAVGRKVEQGSPVYGVEDSVLAVVASLGSETPLNFSFCYAYEAEHAAA